MDDLPINAAGSDAVSARVVINIGIQTNRTRATANTGN